MKSKIGSGVFSRLPSPGPWVESRRGNYVDWALRTPKLISGVPTFFQSTLKLAAEKHFFSYIHKKTTPTKWSSDVLSINFETGCRETFL